MSRMEFDERSRQYQPVFFAPRIFRIPGAFITRPGASAARSNALWRGGKAAAGFADGAPHDRPAGRASGEDQGKSFDGRAAAVGEFSYRTAVPVRTEDR